MLESIAQGARTLGNPGKTRETVKKIVILAGAAIVAIVFFALDLHSYLTLEGMKASLGQFEALRAASPWGTGLAFFAVYVLVTALSFPGALVLTLTAGALFGLTLGTSTVGRNFRIVALASA